MSNKEDKSKLDFSEERGIDYAKIISQYFSYWPWFIASVLFFLSLGFIYGKYETPNYRISARLLVNDEKKGGGVDGDAQALGNLSGLLGSKSTVDNEIEILKTKSLMESVVKDLHLNITYFIQGRLRLIEVYEPPFTLKQIKLNDTVSGANMKVSFINTNKIKISIDEKDTIVALNNTFFLPGAGYVQIVRNEKIINTKGEYIFYIQSIKAKVGQLVSNLNVSVANKQITIIDLVLSNPIPKKGEDILTRLISNYVKGNISDKNEVADSTIAFIKRRLMILGSELGDAEEEIQGFKQKNNLADMSEQGRILVTTSAQYINDLAKVETQISIINSIIDFLKDENPNKGVLPSTLIPGDLTFSGAIENYNLLLLERGRKLIGVTDKNPIIYNLDKQIAKVRADIQANLNSTLAGLTITKAKINDQMSGAEGQIKEVPATERNYLKLARQQQIKQELYIFLMQKSEETAISKTSNIANSKTIDPPSSEAFPYTPQKSKIYLIALLLGLLSPFIILYFKDLLNNKVSSKEDILDYTNVPIVGEISHNKESDNLIVAASSRSSISEQFRAMRTNLSFYLNDNKMKILLVSSSMSGEGKSFIAINLGNILALAGKRVLLMELDLRKPGLASKMNMENVTGFTNYIISDNIEIDEIIKPTKIHSNLFLISSGPIPPNPAEILMSLKTEHLMEKLKNQFDYIIIDAPPIGIIADAQLLSPYVDICLYIVRQNFTFKKQLNIVQDLYDSNKMQRLGIVVNDIDIARGYGYGYGYSYGYGYGEYGNEIPKKWWKRSQS